MEYVVLIIAIASAIVAILVSILFIRSRSSGDNTATPADERVVEIMEEVVVHNRRKSDHDNPVKFFDTLDATKEVLAVQEVPKTEEIMEVEKAPPISKI